MERITTKDAFLDYEVTHAGDAIELKTLAAIDKEKGYGDEILGELLKTAKEKGLKKVFVNSSTDPGREAFGKWLVSAGFKREEGDDWFLEIKEKPKKVIKRSKRKK